MLLRVASRKIQIVFSSDEICKSTTAETVRTFFGLEYFCVFSLNLETKIPVLNESANAMTPPFESAATIRRFMFFLSPSKSLIAPFSALKMDSGSSIVAKNSFHSSEISESYTFSKIPAQNDGVMRPPAVFQNSAYFSSPYFSRRKSVNRAPKIYASFPPGNVSRAPVTSRQLKCFPSAFACRAIWVENGSFSLPSPVLLSIDTATPSIQNGVSETPAKLAASEKCDKKRITGLFMFIVTAWVSS